MPCKQPVAEINLSIWDKLQLVLGSVHCGELQRKDALMLDALKERLAFALRKGIRQAVSSGRKDLAEVRSRPLSGEWSTMCLYGFSCHAGSQRKAPIHGNQGLLKEARKKKKLAEIKGIV